MGMMMAGNITGSGCRRADIDDTPVPLISVCHQIEPYCLREEEAGGAGKQNTWNKDNKKKNCSDAGTDARIDL